MAITTERPVPVVAERGAGRWGALAGVAAAAAGLGVAELAAVLIGPRSAPVVAVGGVVVDHVPAAVKDAAIAVFGVHDKTALITGTLVLLALAAAGIGALAVRSLAYAVGGTLAFGAVGVAAALTRPGANVAWALPSLVAVAGALAAGWFLLRLVPAGSADTATARTVTGGTASAGAGSARTATADTATAGFATGSTTSAGNATGGTASAGNATGGTASAGNATGGTASAGNAAGGSVLTGEDSPGGVEAGARSGGERGVSGGTTRRGAGAGQVDPEGRRRFLKAAGLVVAGAAAVGYAGRWLSTRLSVAQVREAVTLPVAADPAPALPTGIDPAAPGISPYVTPNANFYRIDTALAVPQVDPESWSLRIHGRTQREIVISWEELLRRPMVERHITIACVSNEVGGDLIGNARWLGVPVKDLLEEAGVLAGADQVVSRSVDGWTCGTPTEVLLDGRDALLAVGMNGEPLPIEHGFPVRMVVPGLYGYVSACKWITEIEVTTFADFDAYWVPRGWSALGPVKTQSRIDTPRRGREVGAGPVTIAGVAWAQHTGIQKVEVAVDEDSWRPAELHPSASNDTWCQWTFPWEATPGEHVISVRATDATGALQTQGEAPVAPDGATGWHTITIDVK